MFTRRNKSSMASAFLRHPIVQTAAITCSCVVAFLPVAVVVGSYFVQPGLRPLWIVLLFCLACLGVWISNAIRLSNLVLKSMLLAVLLLVPALLFSLFAAQSPRPVALTFLGLITILVAIVIVTARITAESGRLSAVWIAGLMVHFGAYFLFTHTALLRHWMPLIWTSSIITVALVYFAVNEVTINTALSSRQTSLSRQVHTFNRAMVVGVLVLVLVAFVALLFFVNLAAIQAAIVHLLERLLSMGQLHKQSGPVHPSGFHFPKQNQTKHSTSGDGWFLRIVAIIFLAFFFVLCVILVWRSLKSLWAWLQRQRVSESTLGYIDEVESLAHESKRISRRNLFHRQPRAVEWNHLQSTEDKVRFLYRHCIRVAKLRGYQFNPSATAHEQLRDIRKQAIDNGRSISYLTVVEQVERLYDPARYAVVQSAMADVTTEELEYLWRSIRREN